jgi:hypothetical protein
LKYILTWIPGKLQRFPEDGADESVAHVDRKGIQLDKKMESLPGLPDFSTQNVPKQRKMCQIATKLTNGHICDVLNGRNIFQMIQRIYQPFPFQGPMHKVNPEWDFWFENIPSGNPHLLRIKNVLCIIGQKIYPTIVRHFCSFFIFFLGN